MRGGKAAWLSVWVAAWALPLLAGLLARSDFVERILRHTHRTEPPGSTLYFDYYFQRFSLELERAPLIAIGLFVLASPLLVLVGRRVRFRVPDPGRRAVVAIVAFSLVSSAVIGLVVLDDFPNSADEWAFWFTARTFADGELYRAASAHPLATPLSLSHYVFSKDGKIFSTMFPGWPVLLALGILLGVPWLANPVLGALGVLFVYRAGREVHDRETALAAAAICAASPFFLFNAGSYFSHAATFAAVSAALFYFQRAVTRGASSAALLCGVASGYALFTRPYTALALLVPMVVFGLVLSRRRVSTAASFVAGGVIFPVLLLAYHRAITGDAFTTPYVYVGIREVPGFLRSGYVVHTPLDGAVVTLGHLIDLHAWLAFGSLLLLVPVLAARKTWREWLPLSMVGLLVAGYWAFAAYGGNQYGPRYWYAGLAPLSLLLGRGFVLARDRLREAIGAERERGATVAVVTLAFVLNFGLIAHYAYHHHRLVRERSQPFRMASEAVTHGVVFLETGAGTMEIMDVHRNEFPYDAPAVFAFHPDYLVRRRGEDAARGYHAGLLAAFPGRDCFVYRYGRRGERGPEETVMAWPPPEDGEHSELTRVDCLDLSPR